MAFPLSLGIGEREWRRLWSPRVLYLAGATGLVFVMSALWYLGVLPLTLEYFSFYSILLFLFALWRPNLAFLLFVSLLPLEIVSVTPEEWGVGLRPYQWTAALIGLSLAVQMATGRLRWPLFSWTAFDSALSVFGVSTLVSGLVNGAAAPKQSLVVLSFIFLYFLARTFLKQWADLVQAFTFFAVPAGGILLWGVLQNILFLNNLASYAVMPGRPNATLPEPDWLGLFILFLLAPTLALMAARIRAEAPLRSLLLPALGLASLWMVLLLTVSRSAWLGAGALILVFMAIAFRRRGAPFQYQHALTFIKIVVVTGALALGVSQGIPLTRFVLFDRAESTFSHDQTITIACPSERDLPERIATMGELEQLGCEHISLEERESRRSRGEWLATIDRPDPNVGIRKMIYAKTQVALTEHPILGVGWGNMGPRLGTDERGASYNTSNMFLEIWAGGGLLALLAFLAFLGLAVYGLVGAWQRRAALLPVAVLAALLTGMLVFNLFNAGLLLGFLFVFLALWPLLRALPDETD